MEHQHVDQQNGQQEQQVEPHHAPENRLQQVILLERGGEDRQLEEPPVTVLEDGPQHAGRLALLHLGDVDFLVAVGHTGVRVGIVRRHLAQVVAVVAARTRRGELAAGKRTRDEHLGVELQRIVDLVVDFVDHREVKERGPRRQQQREHPRDVEDDAVDELHRVTSL